LKNDKNAIETPVDLSSSHCLIKVSGKNKSTGDEIHEVIFFIFIGYSIIPPTHWECDRL
jgi:hypothetical protein